MLAGEGLEILGRLPERVQRRFARLNKRALVVSPRLPLRGRPARRPGTRFVEVGLLVEHERLDREQDLEDGGLRGVPLLPLLAEPSVEQAQADVPALVQIRVEPQPVGPVMDIGWPGRVPGREADVEEEERVVVGSAGSSDDDGPEEVDARLVHAHVDGIREVLLQNPPLLHDGLVKGSVQLFFFARVGVEVVGVVGNDVESLEGTGVDYLAVLVGRKGHGGDRLFWS